MQFQEEIKKQLKKLTNLEEIPLSTPPDQKLGDYAFPCFVLSKEEKKAPNVIAEELSKKIELNDLIKEAKAVGPYLNFFINKSSQAEQIIKQILKEKQDYGSKISKKKVIVEYSSPNTNKPLHLGHIRNCFLGMSVGTILKKIGNKVQFTQIINDRGIHISKSMLAYKLWGNNEEPDIKSDHYVGKFYVMYSQKETEEIKKQSEEMLRQWEAKDPEVRKLWAKMNEWVYKGFNATYEKMGSHFDFVDYESKVFESGKEIILKNLEKGACQKDESGAIVIDLSKEGLGGRDTGTKALLKADGTSMYITQDIGLAVKRFEDHNANQLIYVVANEQNYHFKVLFTILENFGYELAKDCFHLSYGMVNLPEGKMKSREGTVVDADDLMQEVQNLAKEEIKKRHKELEENELNKRAHQISLGALKFFILKMDPSKDMMYNPKESVSFEGETGPYVQYAHARACSILRKYEDEITTDVNYEKLNEHVEIELIKLLQQYPSVIEDAAKHYKPSLIARYLIQLAQSFNNFYHACHIIGEDEAKERILLVVATKEVIKNGLSLLGIESPEEM
jgi:arginyl-tRNA synthetase